MLTSSGIRLLDFGLAKLRRASDASPALSAVATVDPPSTPTNLAPLRRTAAFPSFRDKRQVSDGGGGQPRWRKDGQELFYRTFDGKMMSVPVAQADALQTLAPRFLFQTRMSTTLGFDAFSVSADGERFLVLEALEGATTPSVNVVLDWTAGLKPNALDSPEP